MTTYLTILAGVAASVLHVVALDTEHPNSIFSADEFAYAYSDGTLDDLTRYDDHPRDVGEMTTSGENMVGIAASVAESDFAGGDTRKPETIKDKIRATEARKTELMKARPSRTASRRVATTATLTPDELASVDIFEKEQEIEQEEIVSLLGNQTNVQGFCVRTCQINNCPFEFEGVKQGALPRLNKCTLWDKRLFPNFYNMPNEGEPRGSMSRMFAAIYNPTKLQSHTIDMIIHNASSSETPSEDWEKRLLSETDFKIRWSKVRDDLNKTQKEKPGQRLDNNEIQYVIAPGSDYSSMMAGILISGNQDWRYDDNTKNRFKTDVFNMKNGPNSLYRTATLPICTFRISTNVDGSLRSARLVKIGEAGKAPNANA